MRLGLLSSFALLLPLLAACSSESDPNHPAEQAGGSAGTGSGGVAGTAGMAGTANGGGAGSSGSSGAGAGAGTAGGGAAGSAGQGGTAGTSGMGPALLSETGLYADIAAETLAEGVEAYAPAYELWSDGAEKRRWVYLPAGTTIDTSDMDYWVYPVGTKLWKEFSRDGVRVETRLLEKQGENDDDWFMMAYQWNDDGTDAVAVPDGVMNARGTPHDVPDQKKCQDCHVNMPDRVLGFSAIQLSHEGEGVTLSDLTASSRLSAPPAAAFTIPGDDVERAALGYLHANCGLCHNDGGVAKPFVTIDMELWLHTDSLADVAQTRTYLTTIGQETESFTTTPPSTRVTPMDLENSDIHYRFTSDNPDHHMPPIGTEIVDPEGESIIEAWINGLSP